jgi:hypothetical protein
LNGLTPNDEGYSPSDVQRVTEIFDEPQFFIDGADSSDIVQGAIGDLTMIVIRDYSDYGDKVTAGLLRRWLQCRLQRALSKNSVSR